MKRKELSSKSYLSVSEAGPMLGISKTAVYKLIRNGEIGAIRIGKIYAISRASLAAMIGENPNSAEKKRIRYAVKKVVKEYGELLRKLGNE